MLKVKMSLCLINQASHLEDVPVNRGIAPSFLTSALDRGEWSASQTTRITPGERAPGTHWMGGWVDPTAGLDDVE
jgi:hypothetical protein